MSTDNVTKNSVEINGQTVTLTKQDQITFLLAKLMSLLELGLNCEPELPTRAKWKW